MGRKHPKKTRAESRPQHLLAWPVRTGRFGGRRGPCATRASGRPDTSLLVRPRLVLLRYRTTCSSYTHSPPFSLQLAKNDRLVSNKLQVQITFHLRRSLSISISTSDTGESDILNQPYPSTPPSILPAHRPAEADLSNDESSRTSSCRSIHPSS
jgi:hypothetical protein